MSVILYANAKTKAGKRLNDCLKEANFREQIDTYTTLDGLSGRLQQPNYTYTYARLIAVVLAASSKELSAILAIKELFRDARIILIVPDRKKDTISAGHRLYPRYLAYADSNFNDVAAVLEKMVSYNQAASRAVHDEQGDKIMVI
jgi:hypothetical protein